MYVRLMLAIGQLVGPACVVIAVVLRLVEFVRAPQGEKAEREEPTLEPRLSTVVLLLGVGFGLVLPLAVLF